MSVVSNKKLVTNMEYTAILWNNKENPPSVLCAPLCVFLFSIYIWTIMKMQDFFLLKCKVSIMHVNGVS